MSIQKPAALSPNRSSKDISTRKPSIGSIFRDYGEVYIDQYKPYRKQIQVLRSIRKCRTPILGGRVIHCNDCGHDHYIYHSCGHSHCPLCQSVKREQWVDKLRKILFDVPHIHMVFTLPHSLNSIAKKNQSVIYSLLMKSAWKTVKTLLSDPSNVGALPGMISVLHTFGSDMKYHLHVHCLVTFGGLSSDNVWIASKRKGKLARYRQINATYKACFLSGLKRLYENKQIAYKYSYSELLELIGEKQWVVHNTQPTMDLQVVENYLSRYINRIAISASRVSYLKENKTVQILYNDYRNQIEGQTAPKAIKYLHPLIFIDQFIQHVLPRYFQKSRKYGLYSSVTRNRLQGLIPQAIQRSGSLIRTAFQILNSLLDIDPYSCQNCKSTNFDIYEISPDRTWLNTIIRVPTTRPPPLSKST